MEIPTESPRKYGVWSDDVSELASGLTGGKPVRNSSNAGDPEPQPATEVDEDFLRTLGDSADKYGR